MGGSLVQPENKRSEIKSKTDPSKKESSAPTCSLVQKDLCVEKDICEPLGDRNTRRQSTDSSERAQHTAQHTRKQMRAKPSSKTDGSVSVDYKRHHRKEESRENGDLSNQKSEKTGSKQDLPVPKEVNDHSSKGFVRECDSQKIDQRQETSSSKTELSVSKNSENHSCQIHNRESNKQIITLPIESECPKEAYSITREFKDHLNKKERRESNKQIITLPIESECPKEAYSITREFKDHLNKKERRKQRFDVESCCAEQTPVQDLLGLLEEDTNFREYSQQMMVNRKQEKHLVKHDICTSSDDVNPGPKDTNRVSSQQMTSDKRERDCSKGDRVVSIDFKSHGPKAEIRISSQQVISDRRERDCSKGDRVVSMDFKSHGPVLQSSWDRGKQIMNEMREKRVSKADFPIALVIKDHCDEAEPRECSHPIGEKHERSSSVMDGALSQNFNQHFNVTENRTSSQHTDHPRERESFNCDFASTRDFRDSCNTREDRECGQLNMNQKLEKSSSKTDFTIPIDRHALRTKREWKTDQMWERPSSKTELPASREDKEPHNIKGTRQSSQEITNQTQERVRSQEEHSFSAEFKDYYTKKENRELSQHADSTMRMRPSSRVSCSSPCDAIEQDMKNENRAHSCRVLEGYFKNSNTFLPDPASIRSPTISKMSAQFRSPFDNFQPQLKISYEDDFQNKIDMIRNNAATLIQSHWRGYAARQQLCRAYDAATVIQAAWRGYITRRNLSGEYQAATAPQFNCRDNQARDDLRAPELRAAQIKNEWREFLQQWVFNQHTSPHASPCKYNECKSPTDLSVKNLAATIIQKWFKGYKTRKSLEKLMQASPVTQTNNSARHTLREPPRNLRFAANSSSDDSSRNYSSGSLDSFTNGRSNLYKTAKSGCSGAFTRQPSSSFTGPFYGKNIRKPQSQEQQIRENVLQGVGQAPVLTNFSSADSAEESEKDTACCQNPSVARQGQTRPLYSEKKLSHKMGATPTTQVYGSPYIHPLPLSIPFSCRKAIALAKSPDPKQDKGRGKTLYNIARAGQDIPMSNKSDFKLSGPAYRPDAFRRRLMLDFQSNQSQRPRDRRKNLYEHQPNKDDKYVLGKAENKPAVTANSPPCCRRHTMPEYSSNPSGFKGRSTFSNSRLNEQERHLPYKQEPDRPKTPNTIDMGNKQTNCNCSHGCSLCKAREKSRPLNDNKPHQSKPFLMFNPETCTGKVTCESPTGNPKDKANETKQSMRHNRREDRDELYPREVAHKPPVLPYSSESCKRKTGCRNCHEPSLELGQNQSNSSRRHDGQQQPEPSKAEPPIRKTFQHALNPTFEEGFGTRAKMSKQNQRSHCAGRECKGDLESCNDMEKTSKRTSATGFTYTGSKGRSDVGSCNTHKHDIQGPGMTPHKTRSDLGCSTFRGPRDASPGADSVSSGNTEANEMTDRWGAFKTGNRFQKELHRSCPTQSAWESTKMRMALKQHHKAATRIQALYRGYKVRQYLQTAGTLDKFDNRDEELRKKESKDVGDGQHFSMHARGSQKGGACQHRRDEHESRFHSESQCYRSALGNVSDGGDLRFNRRSRT